jgi:hypothetical protein
VPGPAAQKHALKAMAVAAKRADARIKPSPLLN